ncbi:hypothetical protein EJ04DRAFT_577050 [Polyplosphaeria fusca]|uniref:C3H1-type domain-containing protein n=1 Tax=Polyplosphaeria fusca TaxID=682080 RepID=A0A9P4V184_9PLEO|nr:hypothetical protein EJ04DRAFT_577050 [Polyplosphaeria fusca]
MASPPLLLSESKVDSLDTHLEQFKLNYQNNQNDLQVILREYSQLLEDYKALRTSYQGKNGISSSSTPINGEAAARETIRNPYILVLVDGNGYVFNDELAKEKEEGGMKAARMLNDAVEKHLRESLPRIRNCRVIVRIYADVTNLSKQLAKAKLVGMEKRSIAAFTAGFTRAMDLFDFVDALDEEGTKFKIREHFKLAAEDSACSHILFAACHDTSYLSAMVPYAGLRDKITLVQGAGFSSDFHQFNFGVTQFPTVFRWSELPVATTNGKASTNFSPPTKKGTPFAPVKPFSRNGDPWGTASGWGVEEHSPRTISSATDANETSWGIKAEPQSKSTPTTPCKYFQKGFCRFGNKCSFQHHPKGLTSPLTNTLDRTNISALLPTSPMPGFIPLNKDGHRLDTVIRAPTQDEWATYNTRFRQQKPCNSYHLQLICTTFNCPFDHSPLEPEARHALQYVLKCAPCPQKGACRSADCIYGHICQKDECLGQMKGCRMKMDLHDVDPKLASMVPAEKGFEHEDVGESFEDANGQLVVGEKSSEGGFWF